MNKILTFLCLFFLVISCKNDAKQELNQSSNAGLYTSYGEKINDDGVLSASEITKTYNNLKAGDTIVAKMQGTIKEVCSKKGCWMKLDLGDDKEVMVRFKDYGFFMPLNAVGEVVINGKAFVSETSVEELQHYAEDAGKSEEDIAAIAEPEITYGFEADGVLLKQD